MFPATWSVMKTLTNTAAGVPFRNTAPYGSRMSPSWIGRLIVTAIGFGFRRGAGLGLRMNLGVLLHSTTAAGFRSAVIGAGYRARHGPWSWASPIYVPFTRPPSSLGSAARISAWELALAAALAPELPGSRSGLAKFSFLPTGWAGLTSPT